MSASYGPILLQGRDDGALISKSPLLIVFGLIGLCFVTLGPTLFILLKVRYDYAAQMAAAERIRQRYPASDVLAHQHATEQRGLPDATGLVHQSHRMATMAADLCSFFRACGTSTAAIFKSLWRKIVTSTARMTVPRGPRHHHRRSQTGASIDLPIMQRPAWQRLASGLLTPSGTLADLNNKSATGRGYNGREAHQGSGTQAGQAPRAPDRTGHPNVQIEQPQRAMTVGLAISE